MTWKYWLALLYLSSFQEWSGCLPMWQKELSGLSFLKLDLDTDSFHTRQICLIDNIFAPRQLSVWWEKNMDFLEAGERNIEYLLNTYCVVDTAHTIFPWTDSLLQWESWDLNLGLHIIFLFLLNKIINYSSEILNGNCFLFYCRNHKDFKMPIWNLCSIKRKIILTLYQQKVIWLWYIIPQKHSWFPESMME